MARPSRKNLNTAHVIAKEKFFDAGAYVRLSAVDRKQKGDSIDMQQAIINSYISERPDIELRETYIDNGLSGQLFERPAFQRMLEDLESGKINCCVTKDLSRLGRNAIETGYYIEKFFPTKGIRYIAINDDYDSFNENSGGIMVSLKNLVNEVYALEIGRKIRATKQMNIRNGCFVGRIPPYGYLKSRESKYKLVPDEYAAPIVKRIFEMAAEGIKIRDILKWLIASEIMPPKRYYQSIGLTTEKDARGHIHWNKGILYGFLHNRVYCGDMVQGKYRTQSYVQVKLPEKDWVITENTHEGIVSRELFAKVQKLFGRTAGASASHNPAEDKQSQPNKNRYNNPSSENIFLRKIFCGHCGYAMRRTRTSETQYSFRCETRQYYADSDCTLVSINENTIKENLLEMIRIQASAFTGDNSAAYTKALRDADIRAVQEAQAEIDNKTSYLKGLHGSLMAGRITKEEFVELKQIYSKQLEELTQREKALRDKKRESHLQNASWSKIAENLLSVRCAADITAGVLAKLVTKILVFEDKKIKVHFKFVKDAADSGNDAGQAVGGVDNA